MIKLVFLILLALVALPHPVSGQTTSSYAIQVETFKEMQKAVKKTEGLKKKGLDAYWKETRPSGKAARYVVYIGNYPSRDEAQKEAKRLKQEGLLADYSIRTLKTPDQKGAAQEQKEPAPQKAESGLVISEITFKLKSPGKETVWIQGNQFFAPTAFAIEEDKPRFVIDIKDTAPVKRELSRIATDGQFIERVRTFYHKENRTLRVVLDLQPDKKYRIGQFFYQAENIYAVEVEGE
ncbi:MAG TPA: SPOR domain-containing protein [Desulfatiglandales bacterium]|nr:SPOR domain-containing protein [Desulfatiglandales bacterium]